MYIAMNRFKVIKGHEDGVRAPLARPGHLSRSVARLRRVSPVARARSRRSHALFLAYDVGEQGSVRELDAVGAVSRRAPQRRRQQAASPRPSGIRGLRDDPDPEEQARTGRRGLSLATASPTSDLEAIRAALKEQPDATKSVNCSQTSLPASSAAQRRDDCILTARGTGGPIPANRHDRLRFGQRSDKLPH